MKLKTLKDLELYEHDNVLINKFLKESGLDTLAKARNSGTTHTLETIRAEAIKWVKDIQPEALLNIEDVKKNMLVEWIMMFFNISEEDLKGGVDDGN